MSDFAGSFRKGGVVFHPPTGLCFWIPAIPRHPDPALWEQRGYQPLERDNHALLFTLFSTLAPVIEVLDEEEGTSCFYARAEDIAFAQRYPIALAYQWPSDQPSQALTAGSESIVLPNEALYPPVAWGTVGILLSPGKRIHEGLPYRAQSIGRAGQKTAKRLSILLEHLQRDSDSIGHYHLTVHSCAQQLAEAYWNLSQQKTPPKPVLQPASIQLFQDGVAQAIFPMPLYSLIAAIQNAAQGGDQWTTDRVPSYLHKYSFPESRLRGETLIFLKEPTPERSDSPEALTFWATYHPPSHPPTPKQIEDVDADVALLTVLLVLRLPKEPDGSTWLWPTFFLQGRDRLPRSDLLPRSEKGGQGNSAGYQTGQKKEIVASFERLTGFHLTGYMRVRGNRTDVLLSPFVSVEQRWLYSIKSPSAPPRVSVEAWRVRLPWIAPFLEGTAKLNLAIYVQKVLSYDPYHQVWEKKLGYYITFHLRISSAACQRTLRVKIGNLLKACSLPINAERPHETVQRFEQALHRLKCDGLISDYGLVGHDYNDLPRSRDKWLSMWLGWEYKISVGSLFWNVGYQEILKRTEELRTQRKFVERLTEAPSDGYDRR